MRAFWVTILVGFFTLWPCAYGTVNARNGVTISTSSTINGKTPNSAVNEQSIAGGVTPAWVYNVAAASMDTDETTEATFTYGAPVVADQTGSCTKVSARMKYQNFAADVIKIGLYTSGGSLLSSGSFTTTGSTSDIDLEVTLAVPQSVTSGTTYWVLFAFSTNFFGNISFKNFVSNAGLIDFSNGYSTFPLSSAGVGTSNRQYRVGMYIQ